MRIDQVMTPCPYTVGSENSIDEALNLMAVHNTRHLPVVDEEGVLGVVSERDLRMAQLAMAEVAVPSVGTICRRDPLVVNADADVAYVTEVMAERRIDFVLISDDSGELAGVFTITDACRLVSMLLTDQELKKTSHLNK